MVSLTTTMGTRRHTSRALPYTSTPVVLPTPAGTTRTVPIHPSGLVSSNETTVISATTAHTRMQRNVRTPGITIRPTDALAYIPAAQRRGTKHGKAVYALAVATFYESTMARFSALWQYGSTPMDHLRVGGLTVSVSSGTGMTAGRSARTQTGCQIDQPLRTNYVSLWPLSLLGSGLKNIATRDIHTFANQACTKV